MVAVDNSFSMRAGDRLNQAKRAALDVVSGMGPGDRGQAMIDQTMATAEHLRPGGTVRVVVVPVNPDTGEPDFGAARTQSFLVTAIVAFDPQIAMAAGGASGCFPGP